MPTVVVKIPPGSRLSPLPNGRLCPRRTAITRRRSLSTCHSVAIAHDRHGAAAARPAMRTVPIRREAQFLHDMKLNPVHERVVVHGSRVRGAAAQRLEVRLTRPVHVGTSHRRERDQLDGVNLDKRRAYRVTPADAHLRPAPQSERQRDVAGRDVLAQLPAELHEYTVMATRRSLDVTSGETESRLIALPVDG